jgi:ribosomal protein L11 methylase PrmA
MLAVRSHLNRVAFAVGLVLASGLAYWTCFAEDRVERDVIYVPTPEPVVEKMLELAKPKKGEVLYDLGCGDGRIVVTAAKKYEVKGTGVDIDPQRIKESNENAEKAGVTDKVKFVKGNLFEMDFHDADVVTLYLLTELNKKLRPKLLDTLKPGSRIVSHAFDMGEWKAEQEQDVNGRHVYFWTIPGK